MVKYLRNRLKNKKKERKDELYKMNLEIAQ